MQIISAVGRIFWVRALVAFMILLGVGWTFGLSSSTKLWVMYNVVPPVLIALAAAMLVGWLALRWSAALWAFCVTLLVIVGLAMYGGWQPL